MSPSRPRRHAVVLAALCTSTVKDGVVAGDATDPGTEVPADTTGPSTPGGVAATADHVTVTLGWTDSTDDSGVTGDQLTRTGGASGTVVLTSGDNSYIDGSRAENTTYTYVVKAVDAAGNRSAASAALRVTTGSAPPAPAGGEMLGGDPRKESIYFVMTARFFDGDTSNDRGGSQAIPAGNAANHDPMFRGDFTGLVDKLDYILGLGFSAVWITPVVLNPVGQDWPGPRRRPGRGQRDRRQDRHHRDADRLGRRPGQHAGLRARRARPPGARQGRRRRPLSPIIP